MVPIKVGIVGFTDQRMQTKTLPSIPELAQPGSQTVKVGAAVREHWVLLIETSSEYPRCAHLTFYHVLHNITGNDFPHDKGLDSIAISRGTPH